jgi:glucose 1-dehydrogenase
MEGASEPDGRDKSVLRTIAVVGSVNADRRHWYRAAGALARLVARRERPENFREALVRRPGDIKVIVQFAGIRPGGL